MNRTTNLFVLLIVISFILPATAIRYAQAATEKSQDSSSTGNEDQQNNSTGSGQESSSSNTGSGQESSSSNTGNAQENNNTGNEQQQSSNTGNAQENNNTGNEQQQSSNTTSSIGSTENNAPSFSGFTENDRFLLKQAYNQGYGAGSGGFIDSCDDWFKPIPGFAFPKDTIPYCHQGFVAGKHDKETGKIH